MTGCKALYAYGRFGNLKLLFLRRKYIGLCDDCCDSNVCATVSVAVMEEDVISQQFSTTLSRNAGLTPLSSRKTSQNARHKPGTDPTSLPSTETFTPPFFKQSNCSVVPGVAAPLAATPSRIRFLSVSTASLSEVRGATLSAIAPAIFSAPTLKFIFRRKVVTWDDFKESRRVERAPALLDLVKDDMLSLALSSEYIPTEYTLMGPFLRHPTPNNGSPPRLSSKPILVTVSTSAAAAASTFTFGDMQKVAARSAHEAIPASLGNIPGSVKRRLSVRSDE
mmetsp:Transcript_29635/g.62842  ORF Transcript_29635/g.62842 Transcript_29635/m.62842 type:complete len:279 (-) Transcript_29635:24-860(-)